MRRKRMLVIFSVIALALSVRWANARPMYNAEFKEKYTKDSEEFRKKVETAKCLVCHGKGADGKENKKIRNDYGKELAKLLKNEKDKQKIQQALDKVYDNKVPDGSETFGERIKAGKLPGGE
jgi:cytochrome c553